MVEFKNAVDVGKRTLWPILLDLVSHNHGHRFCMLGMCFCYAVVCTSDVEIYIKS